MRSYFELTFNFVLCTSNLLWPTLIGLACSSPPARLPDTWLAGLKRYWASLYGMDAPTWERVADFIADRILG